MCRNSVRFTAFINALADTLPVGLHPFNPLFDKSAPPCRPPAQRSRRKAQELAIDMEENTCSTPVWLLAGTFTRSTRVKGGMGDHVQAAAAFCSRLQTIFSAILCGKIKKRSSAQVRSCSSVTLRLVLFAFEKTGSRRLQSFRRVGFAGFCRKIFRKRNETCRKQKQVDRPRNRNIHRQAAG